jgi:hypothetical protein
MRCKTNALLEINHSVRQRAYVDWKFRLLAPLVRTPPKARRGNGSRVAYRFVTRSDASLTPLFRLFYRSGRKRVPELRLSPLVMAVWFMDDGSKSRNAMYLNTQQFDLESQMRLIRLLDEQWGIKASLNRDKMYWRIRVSVQGSVLFSRIVSPLVLSDLRYKLPHDPVTTAATMAKVASPVQHGQIHGRHNTPTPRSLVEQGEDIVCAAGNGGCTCDVGSSHPGAGAGPKGWAVRPLKRHASWV